MTTTGARLAAMAGAGSMSAHAIMVVLAGASGPADAVTIWCSGIGSAVAIDRIKRLMRPSNATWSYVGASRSTSLTGTSRTNTLTGTVRAVAMTGAARITSICGASRLMTIAGGGKMRIIK